jgi:formamidopyrimidine-DNA glycosylase
MSPGRLIPGSAPSSPTVHLAYIKLRRLGTIGLAEFADSFIDAEGLGRDALNFQFDFAVFERALSKGKRAIKSVLMDQTAIAGDWQYLFREILFQACLQPKARAGRVRLLPVSSSFQRSSGSR